LITYTQYFLQNEVLATRAFEWYEANIDSSKQKKEFWEEKLLEFDYGLLEGHEYLVTSFPY
jgi:hypothetical protein